jgi:hypothetical protein
MGLKMKIHLEIVPNDSGRPSLDLTTGAVAGAGPGGVPGSIFDLALRACAEATPSVMAGVSASPALLVFWSVVVSLVTNLTLCNDPFRRHHAADVPLRSAGLGQGLLSSGSSQGAASPHHFDTFTRRHTAPRRRALKNDLRASERLCQSPHASHIIRPATRRFSARSSRIRRVPQQQQRISRRQRDDNRTRSNLSFRRRASPVQVPPTADRVL